MPGLTRGSAPAHSPARSASSPPELCQQVPRGGWSTGTASLFICISRRKKSSSSSARLRWPPPPWPEGGKEVNSEVSSDVLLLFGQPSLRYRDGTPGDGPVQG